MTSLSSTSYLSCHVFPFPANEVDLFSKQKWYLLTLIKLREFVIPKDRLDTFSPRLFSAPFLAPYKEKGASCLVSRDLLNLP